MKDNTTNPNNYSTLIQMLAYHVWKKYRHLYTAAFLYNISYLVHGIPSCGVSENLYDYLVQSCCSNKTSDIRMGTSVVLVLLLLLGQFTSAFMVDVEIDQASCGAM